MVPWDVFEQISGRLVEPSTLVWFEFPSVIGWEDGELTFTGQIFLGSSDGDQKLQFLGVMLTHNPRQPHAEEYLTPDFRSLILIIDDYMGVSDNGAFPPKMDMSKNRVCQKLCFNGENHDKLLL